MYRNFPFDRMFVLLVEYIIQRLGIGPAAYVANAADLRLVIQSNKVVEFADDSYLLIPASNANSRSLELKNV